LEAADTEASIVEEVKGVFAAYAQDSSTVRQFMEGAREVRSFIGCLRYIH
jgi:hypothetical protein